MLEDAVVYARCRNVLPPRSVDGVVPIPGRDLSPGGPAGYWLTGTVTSESLEIDELRSSWPSWWPGKQGAWGSYRFPISVGEMRFVASLQARRRDFVVQPGSRVTVECSFAQLAGWEEEMDHLPEGWGSDWKVLQTVELPDPACAYRAYLVEMEPSTARRA